MRFLNQTMVFLTPAFSLTLLNYLNERPLDTLSYFFFLLNRSLFCSVIKVRIGRLIIHIIKPLIGFYKSIQTLSWISAYTWTTDQQ